MHVYIVGGGEEAEQDVAARVDGAAVAIEAEDHGGGTDVVVVGGSRDHAALA